MSHFINDVDVIPKAFLEEIPKIKKLNKIGSNIWTCTKNYAILRKTILYNFLFL